MLVNREEEGTVYEKLTTQQRILEEILLDILLKKEEIRKERRHGSRKK